MTIETCQELKLKECRSILKEGQRINKESCEENQVLNNETFILEKECAKFKRVVHDVLARDKVTRELKTEVLRVGSSLQMLTEKEECEMMAQAIDSKYPVPVSNYLLQESQEDPENAMLKDNAEEENKECISRTEFDDILEENRKYKEKHGHTNFMDLTDLGNTDGESDDSGDY